MPITDGHKIEQLLERRVEKIYPSKEALKKVLLSRKKLKLYQGFDPSSPNLHIGHLTGLLKLKEFQELGHEVIFLIGDFTGMIGDPTGKIEGARPQLSHDQVLQNAKDYKKQVSKILNFSGENPVKVKYNGEWLGKLTALETARLMRHLTVPQVVKRNLFQERMKKGQDLFYSEFLYPLLQAYDCVHMDVDLEVGGSDQMFNMLIGRDLMKKIKKKEKFVMTTKLLVDSEGNKIGKTEGNAININNPPKLLFSQIMSLPDDTILLGFELITNLSVKEIEEIKKQLNSGKNPMDLKKRLAWELTKMLNDKRAADQALSEFEKVYEKGDLPSNLPDFPFKNLSGNPISPLDLLTEAKLADSRSEGKRLIKQAAVELNGKVVKELDKITLKANDIIRVGKTRWLKLV